MKTISIRFSDMDKKMLLYLGYVGENLHRRVLIDCKKEFEEMPGAIPALVVTAPNGVKYPVNVTVEGSTVMWDITNSDLIHHGNGEIQLALVKDEEIGKSARCRTKIDESIEPDGEAPDPIQNWLVRAEVVLEEIPEEVNAAIQEAKDSGLFDGVGISSIGYVGTVGKVNTYRVNLTDGSHYDFTVENGDDGVGIASIVKTGTAGLVDTYTITLTNNQTYTFTVTNGENGVQIDDTTPALNKTFSSSKVDDELTRVKSALQGKYTKPADGIPGSDLEDGVIPVVHNVPSGGTTGQALVKSSGSDYDVEWENVERPTDQQVQSSVDNWLDEHPEATTTVQDGAITIPKLEASLKNDVIIEQESEQAYFHNVTPQSVSFYPDERIATVSCKYVKSANLIENKYETGTQNGVTKTKDGRFLKLKGTQNNGQLRFINISDSTTMNKLKGKTVNVYVYIKKSTNWESSSTLQMNDGISNIIYGNFYTNSRTYIGWTKFEDINIAANATQLYLRIQSTTGNVFADGDFAWVGIYENKATDTEYVIEGDDPYTIALSDMNYVDTMMHKSTVVYITPTKKYVDDHTPDIIGYWNDNVYAMPEKFGAVGDGVTDDTQAILDCIDYAGQTGKAVRGYGKYKITSTILLHVQYLDVYLKHIIYTGNDAAVQLSQRDIRLEFHTIDSANIGILHSRYSTEPCARHKIVGNVINSTGDCIKITQETYYSTFEIKYLNSENGNCITFVPNGSSLGECAFFNCSCRCPNGSVIEKPVCSKFYNFTVESNCFTGINGGYQNIFYGWRHREQADTIASRVAGNRDTADALFKITNKVANQILYECADDIYWFSIDTSASGGYDDYEGSTANWLEGARYGEINCKVKGSGIVNGANTGDFIASKVLILCGNKIFVPNGRKIVHVTRSTVDYRLFESMTDADISAASGIRWGTDYIIDTSQTTIYLTASHCALGYNHLTVTQENGNTATIYDKLGNVLFNGSSLGDGVYELVCKMDTTSSGRWGGTGSPSWWTYDGTNELWEIKKIE